MMSYQLDLCPDWWIPRAETLAETSASQITLHYITFTCLAKQKMRHTTTHQKSVHRTDTLNNTELFIEESQDDVSVEHEIMPQNSLHCGKL